MFRNKLRKIKSLLNDKKTIEEKVPEYSARIGERCAIDQCEFGVHNSVGPDCFLYKVSIGDFTYLSKNVSVLNTKIGKFCSIAQGVAIASGDHPSKNFVSTHPAFFSPFKQSGYSFTEESYFPELGLNPNIVGNDVWIGANAIVMNNITIGDGAIVGAGAIVTKNVPPYAVVVGNPAKILRYRFNEDDIRFLLDTKWWNRDNDWIEKNFKSFHDIQAFKKII